MKVDFSRVRHRQHSPGVLGLSYAELRGVNLQSVDLQRAYLGGADLQGANLRWANLQDANLVGANLQDALILNANLQGAFLERAKLQDASLYKANLEGAILTLANLRGASLVYANLKDAAGERPHLQTANLERANLQSTYLRSVKLQGAKLSHTNLQDADLIDAKLQGADLSHTNLQDADRIDAKLQGADLRYADLRRAKLWGANLQDANLTEAKFQDVDLSAAENMAHIYLDGAWLENNRMRQELFGDAIGEERERDYAAAKRIYLALKQSFDDLGDYEAASWAYRKERRMEKLEAWQDSQSALSDHEWREVGVSCFKFLSDTFVELLCDYGESVWRVVGWIAVLLFVIGPFLMSRLGGLVWPENLGREFYALSSPWDRFWFSYQLYLLYTFDALTTASFSDLRPSNNAVRLASGCFAMAGIVLAGLLGFVAGNRIRRS